MSAIDHQYINDSLYVESTGMGEDVVLLHGWGLHGAYWQNLISGLKDEYRLHSIDLPGHGKSTYRHEHEIDVFVERILQSIEGQIDKPFHLIGWSMGGLISQQLVLHYPDKIKSLILVASSPSFIQRAAWPHGMNVDVLRGFAENLREDYKTTLNRFLALQVMGIKNQKTALRDLKQHLFSRGEPDSRALMAGLRLLKDIDLRNEIGRIQQPVMLLGGERDTLVPQAALLAVDKLLPNSILAIIKGAGHAPFLSHPDSAIAYIKAFLEHE